MRLVLISVMLLTLMSVSVSDPNVAEAGPSPVSFADVTASSGIAHVGSDWGGAWGDFNGDGWPDLWANHHWGPKKSLYINQRNGTFLNRTDLHPVYANIDAHGASWADFDNNGRQDLIQLKDGGGFFPSPNWFLVNNGTKLVDEAAPRGLDYPRSRGRTPLWVDYDRDGRLDLVVAALQGGVNGNDPPAIFRQKVDGSFENVNSVVGFNLRRGSNYVLASDLTGDGTMELLTNETGFENNLNLRNGFPARVLDTTTVPFTDVRQQIGLPIFQYCFDAVIADFDNDLRPDIFTVGGEGPNDVFQHDNDTVYARLQPSSSEVGFNLTTTGDATFSIGPAWLVKALGLDHIYIGSGGYHPTSSKFTLSSKGDTNVGIKPHAVPTDKGIYIGYEPASNTWTALYNRPGSDDLTFVVDSSAPVTQVAPLKFKLLSPAPPNRLLMNTSAGWVNRLSEAGLSDANRSVNVVAGDFNNDMYVDLYIVNTRGVAALPSALFLNDGDGTFTRLADAGGAAGSTTGRSGVAALADYDRNGFLDIFLSHGRKPEPFYGPYQLFRNLGNANHWIEINLVGVRSNRDAVGARLELTAGGITQLREQNGGMHERGAQNHKRIHFGLGSNTRADQLKIRWPSGTVQIFQNIEADRIITITEPTP